MHLKDKFKKCAGIYVIRNNINGKYYIGESLNIRKRMWEHSRVKNKQVIHKAIAKYGIESFTVNVEYLPNFKKKDLIEFEKELIKIFNSISPNGYNICYSGCDNTGRTLSEETRKRISLAGVGRIVSEETRKKSSDAQKGRKFTPTHIENLKIGASKRIRIIDDVLKMSEKIKRPVIQINENGEIVGRFESIKEASEKINVDGGDVSRMCNNKPTHKGTYIKSVKGFIWRFEEMAS